PGASSEAGTSWEGIGSSGGAGSGTGSLSATLPDIGQWRLIPRPRSNVRTRVFRSASFQDRRRRARAVRRFCRRPPALSRGALVVGLPGAVAARDGHGLACRSMVPSSGLLLRHGRRAGRDARSDRVLPDAGCPVGRAVESPLGATLLDRKSTVCTPVT